MNNQKLSGGSLPLSAQLWSSIRYTQPRTTVPLSRKLLQPPEPPSALKPISDSLASVSSKLCVDYIVSTGSSYLSRDKLLRKMYQRRVHYRTFVSKRSDPQRESKGIRILGPPFDCWLTFPLQYSHERILINAPEDSEEVLARCWQVKSSREMVIKDVGFRDLPAVDRLTFSWITNDNGTKFRSMIELIDLSDTDSSRIDGLVECIKCGGIIGIGYLLPKRFEVVTSHLFEKIDDLVTNIGTIMRSSQFGCLCDGIPNPRVPIISENYRKINWFFLFCGNSLGYCTEEQLRYFCNQRKLDSSGNKNELLRAICLDLSSQIEPSLSARA